ncbi:RING finger and WD repeat domain-containing protein 3 [Sparganum proliferum]
MSYFQLSLSSVSDPDDEPEFVAEHRLVIPLDEDEVEDGDEKDIETKPPSLVQLDTSLIDESETCPICFESWTTSGAHRICCLRCGHLFGKSCILKWLATQGRVGKCPQCNAKAQSKDIRVLFCKKIKAVDTTDRDRALTDLDLERKLRRKLELELSEFKFKYQVASDDAGRLRDELASVRAVMSALKTSRSPSCTFDSASTSDPKGPPDPKRQRTLAGSYEIIKSMLLSPTGRCRVVAACDYINLLCVSQPSGNPLFKGFGFRKVHTGELRPLKYIHLHSQPIRDLAFHPEHEDGIVVSASMDKSLKLTSLLVDQVVQAYQCPAPVWSCCWASPSPNYIFAGSVNGSVLLFDIRVTSGPVETISIEGNSSPVTALQYLTPDFNSSVCQRGGLLVGQLTQVSFLEEMSAAPPSLISVESQAAGNAEPGPSTTPPPPGSTCADRKTYRAHPLPLEGSLISLSCVSSLRLLLASYRPSQRIPRVRHLVAELVGMRPSAGQAHAYECNEITSLFGGTQMRMLSRARLFRHEQSENVFAVAGDDDSNGALLWNCTDGSRLQTLVLPNSTNQSPVLDVCPIDRGNRLALLTDRQLHLFQWSPSTSY